MRICLVTETYWPDINGVAMTLDRVFRALQARGHEIQLVCPNNPSRQSSNVEHVSTYFEAPSFSAPGYVEVKLGYPINRVLARLWRREPPDAIYVATEGPLGYFATRLARKLKLPIASGFHTNFQSYSTHYKLGFIRPIVEKYLVHMHNLTQRTIVPTIDQKQLLNTMGIRDVSVIGRGIDTTLFNPERRSERLRHDWQVAPNTPVMIYVGRIAEEKNLGLTLQAYKNLKQLEPALKFVMVGSGPAVDRISKQYPDILLTGPKTGVSLAEHYASADFFVFSSLTETYGNVILEAMASGIGILAYRYAAGKIHIQHQVNGLVATPGDEAEFLDAASQFITDPQKLDRMRAEAARHTEHFSWTAIAEEFETVFASLNPGPATKALLANQKQKRFA